MEKPLVVIIMGSAKDEMQAKKILEQLEPFSIEAVLRVASAHKTPHYLSKIVSYYESLKRPKVYVTIAGRSNGLSGVVDGLTSSVTIACPPYSDSFSGFDIFSSIRMPEGISPALILEPANVALFVAKMFSSFDDDIKDKVRAYMLDMQKKVLKADIDLSSDESLLSKEEKELLK